MRHTSDRERGQIYVGSVNWIMLLGVLLLVLEFRSSSALAAAYGIAVSGTMIITSILVAIVFVSNGWSFLPALLALLALFVVLESGFLASNLSKVADGGWFPLLFGSAVFLLPDDLEERLITGGATTQCDRPAGSGYCRERTAGHSTGPRHSDLPGV